MTILGMSWDHRALDGALSAQFLRVRSLRDYEAWTARCAMLIAARTCQPRAVGVPARHVDYREALALQERVRAARQAGAIPDTLLLLEHPRVYTRGRRSAPGELSLGEDFYRAQGIEIVEVNRGGKITYHGPGQLVGYPIVRRRRRRRLPAHDRARARRGAADAGSRARAAPEDGPDYTGVWVEDRKIASIGVHVPRGVTTHGFAVNVDNDLTRSSGSCACGLAGVSMTSLARETGGGAPRARCVRRAGSVRARPGALGRPPAAGSRRRACGATALAVPGVSANRRRRLQTRYPRRQWQDEHRLSTRSRSNPGGMDVLTVLGADVRPIPRAQAAVVQGPRPRRRALPRAPGS